MAEQELHQVIISVGSNIDPQINIPASREILAADTQLLDCADTIETRPVGYENQPNFLNTAYLVATPFEFDEFNAFLKSVEDRMGRERGPIKSGPRTIDLDIIIWDGDILNTDYYHYDYVSIPVDQIISTNQIILCSKAKTSG
ncbi:MAG: 2-amino-4-hydroxy-6-hydroxymethyldihydropteridine diphosphokinase [Porticoccus sp.]|nr:2-amino-4-hydroxy-6-hydroxymethyldihydropteridine diphosphokinase [Porticoccus sp.]